MVGVSGKGGSVEESGRFRPMRMYGQAQRPPRSANALGQRCGFTKRGQPGAQHAHRLLVELTLLQDAAHRVQVLL